MKTYVVGDIHGAHKALVQVLERSGFQYHIDTLITIGDIVDGWGESYEVIEELLKIKNRIDIMGNHDQWMYEFITTGIHPDSWSQGGLATAKSYARALGMDLIIDRTAHEGFTRTF
jgi:serine/threonine protein phosphatase 1